MIYIYRRQSSNSAKLLTDALGARRWGAWNDQRIRRRLRQGDSVVCWGDHLSTSPAGVVVINGTPLRNKLSDAEVLTRAGVPTITFSRVRPVVQPPPIQVDPAVSAYARVNELMDDWSPLPAGSDLRSPVSFAVAEELRIAWAMFHNAIGQAAPVAPPPAPSVEWLGRLASHIGGNDLLNPPANPDFWVKKEEIIREFRVHSFNHQSIRAGVKTPREGFIAGPQGQGNSLSPHPWVRSWVGGWRISYDGSTVHQAHRDLAHGAVDALGLTFGAVDIAQRPDGSLFVLEVNRAPGLEGGTTTVYADAIRRMVNEG